MKIEKVTLKESDVVEVDGEFRQIFKNERVIPCFLTNYSLKKGKDAGLINGSLVADITKLAPIAKVSVDNLTGNELKDIDEIEMLKVIYIGCLGANKNFDLDFDGFVLQYHEKFETTMQLWANLISSVIQKDPNQFAKGFTKSTKRSNNNKKKFKNHKYKSNA